MRIAVIGMGNVGSALGCRWAEVGHEVTFCVRDPDDPQKRARAEKAKAAIGPVGGAARTEAVLLAVPWGAVPDAPHAAGDLSGKVLLDCTNLVTPELTHLMYLPTKKWFSREVGAAAPYNGVEASCLVPFPDRKPFRVAW
jgi:predicted dinucleotide-binding enzyme